MVKESSIARKIYVLAVVAAIIAAFSSFFTNEVKALLFLFAIVMDTMVNKGILKSRPLILLLLFFLVSFVYVFAFGRGHFSEIRNVLLPYPMMLMCFWIAPGLLRLTKTEARFIWIVFLAVLIENLVATAVIGQTSPWLMREMFSGEEGDFDPAIAQAFAQLGLMSYQSAHLLGSLAALLVVMAFEAKKIWLKIILIVTPLLAVFVMYVATVTTALLTGVMSMLAAAVFYFNKGNIHKTIVGFVFLTVLLLVTGSLSDVLFSSSKGGNNEMAQKLSDVAETIETGKGQGQVAGREDHYQLTFEAIWRNPLFGGANGPNDTGQHAMVFDYWAYYGVFCLLLFVGWWKEIKRMKKWISRKRWNAYLICLLSILIMSFLKGPFFLPYYILASIVILRVGFVMIENEYPDVRLKTK